MTNFNIYPYKAALATIQSHDEKSKTYTVLTQGAKGQANDAGGRSFPGVPRKTLEPNDSTVLPNHTTVIVDFSVGFPIISGIIPAKAAKAALEGVPDTSPDMGGNEFLDTREGGEEYTGGFYRQPGDPKNMFSGDWCRNSPDGNFISALRGKLCKVYGSDRAQVITSGYHNLVRTVCEHYEHFSSFGDLTIHNKNGRCNLKFVGAADQLNENREGNWTFHLDIGDEGQLFNMRVTSPDGRATNAEFKITPDGEVRFFGKKSWIQETAGVLKQTVGGDLVRSVQGEDRKTVDGASTHTYGSSLDTSVGESRTANIGDNDTHTVGGSLTTLISKQRVDTITGGLPTEADPLNVAYDVNIINGSYIINIGDKTRGANPTAFAGYKVYVNNGAVVLGENPVTPAASLGGVSSVNLNTLGVDSVGLGCIVPTAGPESAANPPTDSAMLYLKWQIFANTLIKLLDGHIHQTAWGPSLPAEVPIGTPMGFSAALSSLIVPVKSLRVMIGA